MVEYFRQESCVILQRGLDVGDVVKLIVLKFKERVFIHQKEINSAKEICRFSDSSEAK